MKASQNLALIIADYAESKCFFVRRKTDIRKCPIGFDQDIIDLCADEGLSYEKRTMEIGGFIAVSTISRLGYMRISFLLFYRT